MSVARPISSAVKDQRKDVIGSARGSGSQSRAPTEQSVSPGHVEQTPGDNGAAGRISPKKLLSRRGRVRPQN